MTRLTPCPFSWQASAILLLLICMAPTLPAVEPSYIRDVQPLLRKYCGGCHNAADKEADFSVASHAALMAGTPEGKVIVSGKPAESRLLKLVRGLDQPQMPPKEEAQPSAAEIAKIEAWIAAGAQSDAGTIPLEEQIAPPKLAADPEASDKITGMIDVDDRVVAVARLGRCELRDSLTQQVLFTLSDIPGTINQLRLSRDGRYLLVAGGLAGVGGQVTIIEVATRHVLGKIQGHSDAIYCAALSPDGKWLATGSYDRTALLWNWREQRIERRFTGHNGAIYDLDIDLEGKVLATASADQTVKLWGLADGTRLDTLGQPEGEMLCVRFTPDGSHVLASGGDRQIRMWEIVSKDRPAINPMRFARFAHEQPVTSLVFRADDQLLSLSEDHTIKLWTLTDLSPLGVVTQCRDVPVGVGKCRSRSRQLLVADFGGSIAAVSAPIGDKENTAQTVAGRAASQAALMEFQSRKPSAPLPEKAVPEIEPNQQIAQAQWISPPVRVDGSIAAEESGGNDVDLYALNTTAGERWVIEINAARSKSPLDSLIDVLDDQGEPVLRTRLQAVRESYFTFRGKDSNTSDDYRMHKWQEMELNELLYAGGEVVKLWLYPRGPDSGFKVYPGYGSRTTFFDTTPTTHALGESAYIVRELAPNERPLPNGLPIFPIYYQNDDDGQRRWGKDSRLTFTAPRDGRYIIRVRDARGFSGDDFKYQLIVRTESPDFELEFKGLEMTCPRNSGREWQVTAKRMDGLQSPIEIHLDGVPEGFIATNPLIIEAGQDIAYGNVFATGNAQLPDGQEKATIKMRALSRTADGIIEHEIDKSITLSLTSAAEVQVKMVDLKDANRELEELVIHPGETISARVIIDRHEHTGPVALGKEDAGRNLPHGSFVDNIGLNGLLITDSASQREFFITAAPWLEPQERFFHLRSDTKNNPTSRSVKLRIVNK